MIKKTSPYQKKSITSADCSHFRFISSCQNPLQVIPGSHHKETKQSGNHFQPNLPSISFSSPSSSHNYFSCQPAFKLSSPSRMEVSNSPVPKLQELSSDSSTPVKLTPKLKKKKMHSNSHYKGKKIQSSEERKRRPRSDC